MMTKEEPIRKQKQSLLAPPPPFSGTSLELICQFLTAEEAGKCCIACKTWRADLMGSGTMNDDAEAASVHPNPFVWRQVALNTSSKSLLMIERLAETEDPLNYYRIGAGLTRASRPVGGDPPQEADEPEMPRPSNPPFDRSNLIAVCELVHRVKVENEDTEKEPEYRLETLEVFGCGDCSTWMDPITEEAGRGQRGLKLTPNPDVPSFTMKGGNPLLGNYVPGPAPDLHFDREAFLEFHRSARERGEAEVYWMERVTPLEVSSVDALYKVHFACMRLILFRRDDWRSVCLKQNCRPNSQTNIYWGGRRYEHPEAVILRLPYRFSGRLPLKDPNKVHEFSLIEALRLEAVLPRPGAPDEPKWLKETRKSNVADLDWTSQDEEEVLGIDSFTFQFKSIAINSIFHCGRSTRSLTKRERLGCLEHFDWK